MRKGLFITLEGIDGTGKGTQTELLFAKLKTRGCKVKCTREPGGPPIAEAIRAVLLDPVNKSMSSWTEAFLYLAARAQNTAENILPYLEQGYIVLSDRYADSTIAYQGGGRQLDIKKLIELNTIATFNVIPDLTLLFDLDQESARERITNGKKLDRLEIEKAEFHQRVRDTFLQLAREEPKRICIIDAAQTPEKVFTQVWNKVEPLVVKLISK
jgi:dTMP kinase